MNRVHISGHERKAPFLTFEGPEGSGKTTQISLLAEKLQKSGHRVLCTREPGGTKLGEGVRTLLLDHSSDHLEPETEMFLMLAQRTEHVKKVIYPALAAGTVVLCDRYLDSSLAYQGYGRGITPSRILRLHLSYLGSCLPDLTVLFDIPPEEGLVRARHGGRKHLDRMEAQDLTFHQKVRAGYLSLARRQAARFLTLDARQNPDEVFSRLTIALKKRFPELLA